MKIRDIIKKPPEIVEKEAGKNKRYSVVIYDCDNVFYHELDVLNDLMEIFRLEIPPYELIEIIRKMFKERETVCAVYERRKAEEKRDKIMGKGYKSDIRMVID